MEELLAQYDDNGSLQDSAISSDKKEVKDLTSTMSNASHPSGVKGVQPGNVSLDDEFDDDDLDLDGLDQNALNGVEYQDQVGCP
jgi:hypothetical protein